MSQPIRPVTEIVVTVLLVLVAGLQVMLLAMVVLAVLGPASRDPHGYTAIFGVVAIVFLTPVTLVLLAVRRWLHAHR